MDADELRATLMRLVVTLPDELLKDAIDELTERVYYHAETTQGGD